MKNLRWKTPKIHLIQIPIFIVRFDITFQEPRDLGFLYASSQLADFSNSLSVTDSKPKEHVCRLGMAKG